MSSELLAWILVAGLGGACVASMALRARSLRAAAQAGAETEMLRGRLASAEKRADERAAELRRRGEETGELKRKLEKTRRRADDARRSRRGEGERLAQLEEEARARGSEAREARAALQRIEEELAKARAESRRLRQHADAQTAAANAAASAAAQASAAADPGKLRELERRAEAAEAEVANLRAAAGEADAAARKLRERVARYQKLYLVIKGELEVARDRVRMLESLRVELGAEPRAARVARPPEARDHQSA